MVRESGENPKDYALWVKFDDISRKEASALQAQIIKDKEQIASGGRGTSVLAQMSELLTRILAALRGLPRGKKDE